MAAFGQITSSSGRQLNLTPQGWVNNEGENLNAAPGSNALMAAATGQQQPAQTQQPQAQPKNALSAALYSQPQPAQQAPVDNSPYGVRQAKDDYDLMRRIGAKYSDKVDFGGKIGYRGKDGEVYGRGPDGTVWWTKSPVSAETMAQNKYQMDREYQRAVINKTQAETAQIGQSKQPIPAGYRNTANGNMEAIPGGPADIKAQGTYNQDTAALQGSKSAMDRLEVAANEALKHPGISGITGLRGVIPNLPGSDAANAQAKLNTLKSQVAFGVLQDMRNNSKTGGALGAVSDNEIKLLQGNLTALDASQSQEQMEKSLKGIIKYANEAKDRLLSAYNMRHAQGSPSIFQNGQQSGQQNPPALAVARLKTNPELRDQFDSKYGAGASALYLGK